jgi:hypothetical protein
LRGECLRRGVCTRDLPPLVFAAVRWAARVISQRGAISTCLGCERESRTHLWCASCDHTYCRACLKIQGRELWDLNFECAGCAIESLCTLGEFDKREQKILDMANDWLLTRSHAIKPGTWRVYRRAMERIIHFMRETKIVAFPVLDGGTARGLCFFFEYQKRSGVSWATMAQIRSAVTNASRAAGLRNPWREYPQLEELTQGLARELTTPTARREGVTINMVKALVQHLEHQIQEFWMDGNMKRADVALRNLVSICFGFFGMRRGAELWANRSRTAGLLRKHVAVVHGSHVMLFLPVMKNDTFGKGTEVVLTWRTASGIPIGQYVAMLSRRLDDCGVGLDEPFFCPMGPTPKAGFKPPEQGKESRFSGVLLKYLSQVYPSDFAPGSPLRKRFSWHSLRRGGATYAFRMGLSMRLVMGHGAWRSEAGIAPYLSADLVGKLSVTRAM